VDFGIHDASAYVVGELLYTQATPVMWCVQIQSVVLIIIPFAMNLAESC